VAVKKQMLKIVYFLRLRKAVENKVIFGCPYLWRQRKAAKNKNFLFSAVKHH
jgi:hypothetical protein